MIPAFFIGSIPICGKVNLAPMDGISDLPFRFLCRKMGSALSVSEFINVRDVPRELNNLRERISFTHSERPFGFQLYGTEPQNISQAAKLLEKKEPDFYDLNLGCSVKRIAGRGAGAGLLKDPDRIRKILSSLKSATDIPITIKMRLGWDQETINYLEIAKIAQGEGVSLITLHGRTRSQNWIDPADWDAISILKKSVELPIIGNGDIKTILDIQNMLNETGCDGVMIGRSSLGNPWLFANIDKRDLTSYEIKEVILFHWALMQSFYGVDRAKIIFKKHLKAYLNCPQFSHLDLQKVLKSENPIRFLF